MKKSYIRINNIEIRKFKNISYGKLKFDNNRKSFKASVLGLYGQNGSGKTALIDALEILKYALTGKSVPAKFAEYINIDSEFAQFKFEFTIKHDDDSEYIAIYELNLNRIEEENQGNIDTEEQNVKTYRVSLSNERISCSYKSHEKSAIMQTIVDTNTDEIFLPKIKFDILIGKNKDTYNKLLLYKKLISLSSRSFIFSREFINVIRQNCNEIYLLNLFNDLILYGNYELFIINTNQSNLISFDALPISFRLEEAGQASFGRIAINLNDTTSVPQDAFDLVCKLIENMNIVLVQLIPGLKIKVKNLGANLTEKGEPAFQLQLLSCRNDKEIPLRNESEGIKKIVSILQLLIVMYNDPSITVAIDELDSGVFEYLLGEILNIISERGLGQLIFTSHNLRPLETLDYGFIAFTTTNPENRYIRIKNKKSNNNLRDLYYRNIILDEQSETLYDATNNGSIAFAFRDAGLTHEK